MAGEERGVSDRTVYEPRVALRRIQRGLVALNDRLRAGDTIIVFGTREQVERLQQLMRGEEVVEEA